MGKQAKIFDLKQKLKEIAPLADTSILNEYDEKSKVGDCAIAQSLELPFAIERIKSELMHAKKNKSQEIVKSITNNPECLLEVNGGSTILHYLVKYDKMLI